MVDVEEKEIQTGENHTTAAATTTTTITTTTTGGGGGDDFIKMTPNQKRLFDLRMKLNESRRRNQQEVVAEDRRNFEESNKKPGSTRQWSDNNKRNKDGNKKDTNAKGEKEEEEVPTVLDTLTAEEAEVRDKKKKKPKPESFGWQMYTEEAQYRSYQKRVKENFADDQTRSEYEKQKAVMEEKDMYKDVNDLSYGVAPKIPKENVDRMVKELAKVEEKKSKFNRRREVNPDADINYINERNKVFNKKIARAFDSYTAEIRQNLERGTAL